MNRDSETLQIQAIIIKHEWNAGIVQKTQIYVHENDDGLQITNRKVFNVVRFKSDPLAAFLFRAQRRSNLILSEITGWAARGRTGSVVKTTALTTIIFITNGEISDPWRVQNVSFAPRLTYTEGDSSRKPRHDRRCYFEFAIEARFSNVISFIYRDISESGNGNSQVGKPQA